MQEETRKHLITAYFLASFLFFLSVPFGFQVAFVMLGFPIRWRVLAFLVLAAFVPGSFMIAVTVWILALAVAVSFLALGIVIWILTAIGSASPVGALVAVALAGGLCYVGVRAFVVELLPRLRSDLDVVFAWWQRVVDLFGWLSYLLFDHSSSPAAAQPPRPEEANTPFVQVRGGFLSIIPTDHGDTMSDKENRSPKKKKASIPRW